MKAILYFRCYKYDPDPVKKVPDPDPHRCPDLSCFVHPDSDYYDHLSLIRVCVVCVYVPFHNLSDVLYVQEVLTNFHST